MLKLIFEDTRFDFFYAGITGFRLVPITKPLPDVPDEVKPSGLFEITHNCNGAINEYYDYFIKHLL